MEAKRFLNKYRKDGKFSQFPNGACLKFSNDSASMSFKDGSMLNFLFNGEKYILVISE